MNIRLEQLNPIIGDIENNLQLIKASYQQAVESDIDLLVLPEMVVTGYPVQDLLEKKSFRNRCYEASEEIAEFTTSTAVLFGNITPNLGKYGRQMYNSALLCRDGKLISVTNKTLLPTYDVFDDLRYFEPNDQFSCVELNGLKLGITICEDIWYNENDVQYHTYEIDPAGTLKEKGAQLIINISASPFTKTKHEHREEMLRNHAHKLKIPVLYCNQTGAHTDLIFDGGTTAINSDATVTGRAEPFKPSLLDVEWLPRLNKIMSKKENSLTSYPKKRSERLFKALKLGLKDYLHKTGVTNRVVFGLSGGIDSALVCVLAAETFGSEFVTAITMPSEFSSKGSVTDSQKLASNLGIKLIEIPIGDIYDQFDRSLKLMFSDPSFGVAHENLQSRIRGSLLMAYANKTNCFLLATGNKSEYAVGYATLYGDMNGALAPIGDLYKTEVYELCRWLNESYYNDEVIPESIITKEPSAELRPDQKDSDTLPPYHILDDILFRYIEKMESKTTMVRDDIDENTVEKVVRLVELNEFKRFQAAPILKCTSKAFGTGRRWPLVKKVD